MIFLISGATKTVARYPELGVLTSPRAGHDLDRIASEGRPWACDNDAYKCWNQEAYWQMLGRVSRVDRTRLLWVAVPDVVADARATLNRWYEWSPQLDVLGLPRAFVAQNGVEHLRDEVPWHELACLFIGGDDGFKLGIEAERLASEAKRRGKLVHMGRVNSRKRMRHAFEIGCDSFDGRQWSAWSETWIPRGRKWLRQVESRPVLFS